MAKTITWHARFSSVPERRIQAFLEVDYAQSTVNSRNPIAEITPVHQPHGHALHYALSVFGGMRARPNKQLVDEGITELSELELALIQAPMHEARFFRSMDSIALRKPENFYDVPAILIDVLRPYGSRHDVFVSESFTQHRFREIVFELIDRNTRAKVINPASGEVYVRPLAYRDSHPEGKLGVHALRHDVVIEFLVQQWGAYLPDGLALAVYPLGIESPLRRIKSAANYAFGAKDWVMAKGFHDALLTDNHPDRNIEEATGANFFAFADETTLITPPDEQYILPGITRATMIEMAEALGFTVLKENIPLHRLAELPAAFLTGTAASAVSIHIVYDFRTGKVHVLDKDYAPFKYLQQQFESMVNGSQVDRRIQPLQQQVRSVIVP